MKSLQEELEILNRDEEELEALLRRMDERRAALQAERPTVVNHKNLIVRLRREMEVDHRVLQWLENLALAPSFMGGLHEDVRDGHPWRFLVATEKDKIVNVHTTTRRPIKGNEWPTLVAMDEMARDFSYFDRVFDYPLFHKTPTAQQIVHSMRRLKLMGVERSLRVPIPRPDDPDKMTGNRFQRFPSAQRILNLVERRQSQDE